MTTRPMAFTGLATLARVPPEPHGVFYKWRRMLEVSAGVLNETNLGDPRLKRRKCHAGLGTPHPKGSLWSKMLAARSLFMYVVQHIMPRVRPRVLYSWYVLY